ncbi:DUF1127 domain-containing protein [Mangrovicoccus ximenensis]|uniref:DUF1127 domain-containing protein n=1 Tax=Mangrovicoccus ximenensis TaxID=1911570 RepID=UPI00191C248D|nr:DUF1127 domain-containing protein [Mangrovicoccus ximenensis]
MAVLTPNMLRNQHEISLGEVISHQIAAVKEWFANERARAELAALDDFELQDLGITRYDIRHMKFPRK